MTKTSSSSLLIVSFTFCYAFPRCVSSFRRRIIDGALSLILLQIICALILKFQAFIKYFPRETNLQSKYRINEYSPEPNPTTTRNIHIFRENSETVHNTIVTGSIPSKIMENKEDTEVDNIDSNHTKLTVLEKIKQDETTAKYFLHDRTVKGVNCKLIIDGNKTEIRKAYSFGRIVRQESLCDGDYINLTRNCSQFIRRRGYIMSELTQEEADFPIAYSILMFKDVEQVEHLLRMIYRPQNIYCVHVDKKSDLSIFTAMQAIASCFDNVFMSAKRVRVTWGYFKVLEADLNCMEELLQRNKIWKYFINLTGQEFPLRTNYELVKILKAYDGANDIEGTIKRANPERWRRLPPPPHNIRPFKGNVHIAASRQFVKYALHNETAKDLLEWVRKVFIPDECYFSTLNHNPSLKIKGSYLGKPESGNHTSDVEKPYLSHFVNWYRHPHHINSWPCHGKWIREVCIFGPGDLQLLASIPHMFANKFHWDYQRYARDCMEELIFNRTRDEYLEKLDFDDSYYKRLGFVHNKVD